MVPTTPSPSFPNEKALVLASGGQDSTTSLVWALQNFRSVQAIGFYYQQKHSVELDAARRICDRLKVAFKLVDLSFLKDIVTSNLFTGQGDVNAAHNQAPSVPSSFVPYRNLIFLTVAAGWAGTIGARHLVTGVCETDYSGYADCRDVFVKSTQVTLNLATDLKEKDVVIHTPLMWLTKAQEFQLAEDLGCLDLVLDETVTCYNGTLTRRDYGLGCGECPACQLRSKGWKEFQASKGGPYG